MKTKLLHMADSHLKHVHRYSYPIPNTIWDRMFEEKMKVLNQLPSIARKEQVSCLAFTGDIFDTINPPEAIKTKFVEWLFSFPKDFPIFIIPGNHETTSFDNHALMDIGLAILSNDNEVLIGSDNFNKDSGDLLSGIGLFHVMLEGISDKFKNTVKYNDERFIPYKTILLGDYHEYYEKTYGDKTFIYSGAPYPTRFGEKNHSVNIVSTEADGTFISCKKIELNAYKMIEIHSDKLPSHITLKVNSVVKFVMNCQVDQMENVRRRLNEIKMELMKNEKCIDFVYSIKIVGDKNEEVNIKRSVQQVSFDYVSKNIPQEYKEAAINMLSNTMKEFNV